MPPDHQVIDLKTAHFIIDNGKLTWCEVQLVPGAEAPVFEAADLYEDGGDEEDDDEDEDEEEDEDLKVVRRR